MASFVTASPARSIELIYFASAHGARMSNGVVTSGEEQNSGPNGALASAPNSSSTATFGSLVATSSSAARASGVLAGPPVTSSSGNGDASAGAVWRGPALDPSQAGLLARVTYNLSGSAGAAASPDARGSGSASAYLSSFADGVDSSGNAEACNSGCSTAAMVGKSGVLNVRAGAELFMGAGATSGALPGAVFIQEATSAGGSGSASLSFSIELIEDRRHWAPAVVAPWAADASWIEKAEPDSKSWAVFNSTDARTLALTVPVDREWRGLIVDGESLTLDLSGKTLTLGSDGPSLKTHSIRVGEGRETGSALTLRNGTVLALNDVLVGGVFGSTGPSASLTLDAGVVLDQTTGAGLGSVLVGDLGPGALVVRGGSRLTTNVLALARNAPGADDAGPLRSTLEISGPGSQITATLVSLGDRGDATATVSAGGVLQTQSLDLAQRPGSTATLTIDGAGSKLVLTGGFADVGAGGRATLQALNGGAIEGNSSIFRVGSGKPSDFSVLRISGAGSRIDDAGVVVNAGGSFELREGAKWTGNANVLEVKGGQATINRATAKVTDLSVEGLFSGTSLVSSGTLTIDNGGVLDATGAHLTVGDGGRLTLTGPGSRLFGFSNLEVNGLLTVNFGSILEGDTLALSNKSSLQGTGTVKVNNTLTAAGQIKPGNSPGLLRIEGNLALTDTAELVLEMAGTTAGTEYDVLQVQGNLTLLGGHVSLAFINGFAPRQGQQFVLLDVSGSFQSSAAFGVTGLETGWQFDTAYDPATGKLTLNSLSDGVSAVPEPGAWLFWGAGLSALLLRRRAA